MKVHAYAEMLSSYEITMYFIFGHTFAGNLKQVSKVEEPFGDSSWIKALPSRPFLELFCNHIHTFLFIGMKILV